MTGQVLRRPGTYAHAMRRVMDLYEVEAAVEIGGAKVRDVYDYSDPRSSRRPPIVCCERWDRRLKEDGHEPLFLSIYHARLSLTEARHAPLDPVEATTTAIRECGEAVNAYLMSAHRAPTPHEETETLREIDEAIAALQRLAKDVERGGRNIREVS